MSNEKRSLMGAALVDAARIYSKQINKETVFAYVDVLEDQMELDEFLSALKKWHLKSRHFPTPADIIEMAGHNLSNEDEAQIVVNKIIAAIENDGWTWPIWKPASRYIGGSWREDALAKIGEIGLYVVDQWGGWGVMHDSYFQAGEVTVWRAQLRNFVETQIRLSKAGRLGHLPKINPDQKLIKADNWQVKLLLMEARNKKDTVLETTVLKLAASAGIDVDGKPENVQE